MLARLQNAGGRNRTAQHIAAEPTRDEAGISLSAAPHMGPTRACTHQRATRSRETTPYGMSWRKEAKRSTSLYFTSPEARANPKATKDRGLQQRRTFRTSMQNAVARVRQGRSELKVRARRRFNVARRQMRRKAGHACGGGGTTQVLRNIGENRCEALAALGPPIWLASGSNQAWDASIWRTTCIELKAPSVSHARTPASILHGPAQRRRGRPIFLRPNFRDTLFGRSPTSPVPIQPAFLGAAKIAITYRGHANDGRLRCADRTCQAEQSQVSDATMSLLSPQTSITAKGKNVAKQRSIDQNLPKSLHSCLAGPSLWPLSMHPENGMLACGATALPPRCTPPPAKLLH